jgi:hypothetical protein
VVCVVRGKEKGIDKKGLDERQRKQPLILLRLALDSFHPMKGVVKEKEEPPH